MWNSLGVTASTRGRLPLPRGDGFSLLVDADNPVSIDVWPHPSTWEPDEVLLLREGQKMAATSLGTDHHWVLTGADRFGTFRAVARSGEDWVQSAEFVILTTPATREAPGTSGARESRADHVAALASAAARPRVESPPAVATPRPPTPRPTPEPAVQSAPARESEPARERTPNVVPNQAPTPTPTPERERPPTVIADAPPRVILDPAPRVVPGSPPGVTSDSPPTVSSGPPPTVISGPPPTGISGPPPAVMSETPPDVVEDLPPRVVDDLPPEAVEDQPPRVTTEPPPRVAEVPPFPVVDSPSPLAVPGTPSIRTQPISPTAAPELASKQPAVPKHRAILKFPEGEYDARFAAWVGVLFALLSAGVLVYLTVRLIGDPGWPEAGPPPNTADGAGATAATAQVGTFAERVGLATSTLVIGLGAVLLFAGAALGALEVRARQRRDAEATTVAPGDTASLRLLPRILFQANQIRATVVVLVAGGTVLTIGILGQLHWASQI